MTTSEMIPKLTLNSGHVMPVVSMGTAEFPAIPEKMKSAYLDAIVIGYRHFDTASLYQTEQPLGEAIQEAIKLGLIGSRKELFITSKLWCTENHPDLVLPSIQSSLRNLKTDYLDLYLIHLPLSVKPGAQEFPIKREDVVPLDLKGVWEAMEECQKLGLTKAIGVSNFNTRKLEELLAFAKIPPAVDQVEMNISWQQQKLKEYCAKKGICITAYSPLGGQGGQKLVGINPVLTSDVLKEIADAKGKTIAQDRSIRFKILAQKLTRAHTTIKAECTDLKSDRTVLESIELKVGPMSIRPTTQSLIKKIHQCNSTSCFDHLLDAADKIHQIALRWLLEQGGSIVVKSFNKDRLRQNLEIFDWELTEEEQEKIGKIPQKNRVSIDFMLAKEGSLNSIDISDIEIIEV